MNLTAAGTAKQTTDSPGTPQNLNANESLALNSSTQNPGVTQTSISTPAPTSSATAQIKANKGISAISSVSAEDQQLKNMFNTEDFNEAYSNLAMKLYKQDVITFSEKGFMETLTTMDIFIDPFSGKKVVITGFVY